MNNSKAENIIRKIAKAIGQESILVGLALVKQLELDKEDRMIAQAYEIVNGSIETTLYKSYVASMAKS